MNQQLPDSGFNQLLNLLKRERSTTTVELTVSEIGFPSGADIIAINLRIQQLGYKSFSEETLTRASNSKHRKIFLGGAKFALQKKEQ